MVLAFALGRVEKYTSTECIIYNVNRMKAGSASFSVGKSASIHRGSRETTTFSLRSRNPAVDRLMPIARRVGFTLSTPLRCLLGHLPPSCAWLNHFDLKELGSKKEVVFVLGPPLLSPLPSPALPSPLPTLFVAGVPQVPSPRVLGWCACASRWRLASFRWTFLMRVSIRAFKTNSNTSATNDAKNRIKRQQLTDCFLLRANVKWLAPKPVTEQFITMVPITILARP